MSSAIVERMAQDTLGMELSTGDEIALESTRHIFLAANLLDPDRARDIGMLGGGEEFSNPCMFRTGGRLPRCEITPVEMWGTPMPLELFPEGVRPLKLKGTPIEDNKSISNPFVLQGVPNLFLPVFPGELIRDVLFERRGTVEIEVLRGVDYGKYDREIQALFFPDTFVKPVELRLIRDHIEQVGASVADPDAKSVADNMLASCDVAREYMEAIVGVAEGQLRERVTFRHVHRLTAKVRSFMAQLEIKPPSISGSQIPEDLLKAVSGSGITPEVLEAIMARQDERFSQALREALATQRPALPPGPHDEN